MMFEVKKLFVTARSVTLELPDGGLYNTKQPYRILVNGEEWGTANTVVHSIYGLWPDTKYVVKVLDESGEVGRIAFRTEEESYTLNVRSFGAVGDGVHDDTPAIQAAINVCPEGGRVLIPAGDYHVLPLFLKSHIRVEIQKGATLLLCTDRSRFPILPGVTFTQDGEYLLGTWEGNPLDCFASAITGVDVEDVRIIGPGVVDGQGDKGDWWVSPKIRRGAWRRPSPRRESSASPT